APRVLYLPQGNYRITATLKLAGRINLNVIGEHPDTTKLVWDGAAGGVMFNIDGVAYSKFNRLTFNGASKAGIAVDQSWNGQVQHFDTGNEYADDRFVDVGTGIRAGNLGYDGAETSILRAKFIRNSVAGINTKTFNTLDW